MPPNKDTEPIPSSENSPDVNVTPGNDPVEPSAKLGATWEELFPPEQWEIEMQKAKEESMQLAIERGNNISAPTRSAVFSLQKTALWGELDAMQFPADRWRVKNLVPKAGAIILAAVSGEGKTWVALELARCIAMGADFLGDTQFATVQGKVLYIDGENSMSEIQRRGRQLQLTNSDQLHFLPIDTLNLNDEIETGELIDEIEKKHFDVVIIDTFRAVAGGLKEEKAEEVRTFFSRFKSLKERGVALVWLDHYRKPSNFEGKLPKKEFLFGSQDKAAGVEVLLMMKKEESEIAIYQRKNRLGTEIRPFKTRLEDTGSNGAPIKTTLTYAGEIDEKESKKDAAKEYIPELLAVGPKTTPEIKEVFRLNKKAGPRNVQDALSELLAEGVVDKRKKGKRDEYFLPTAQTAPESEVAGENPEDVFGFDTDN